MRILQVCKKFPYPLNDGESIAVTFLAAALRDLGHEVDLLSLNTTKHFVDLDSLPPDFNFYRRVAATRLDNRVTPWNVAANLLFSRKSFHVSRFVNEAFRQRLIRMLKETSYDLVLLETIILAPYIDTIRQHSDAKVVMRAHNVEHEIWVRVAANSSPLRRLVLQKASHRLRKFELEAMNKPDLFVAISEPDLVKFRALGLRRPAIVTPIGIDAAAYLPDDAAFDGPLRLSFIGSLDWLPNVEGLRWFLDKVWPALHARYPNLEFHVAGKKAPPAIMGLDLPGVTVHGEVADAPAFTNAYPVMVVPLLAGSGIRAKIIEAMMLGRVVITTTIGLLGIPAGHGHEVLVADTVEDFVRAVDWCVAHPDELLEMGRRAARFAREKFDNKRIAVHFIQSAMASLPALRQNVMRLGDTESI